MSETKWTDEEKRVGEALRAKCKAEFGSTWSNDIAWSFARVAIAAVAHHLPRQGRDDMSDITTKLDRLKPLVNNHALNAQHAPEIIEEAKSEIFRLRAALEAEKERCAKVAVPDLRKLYAPTHGAFDRGYQQGRMDAAAAIRSLPSPPKGEGQ